MNKLRSQVKTMAVLCVALGPILIAMSLMGIAAQRLLKNLVAQGLAPPQSEIQAAALDFSVRSTSVSVPLGLVLSLCGVLALRDLARGRKLLIYAAWISVAGMIGLAIMWSVTVAKADLGVFGHVSGWVTHGVQAVLAAMTARWLGRDDVRSACE